VRSGYKQTEVGRIPHDWEIKSVAEISRILTGPFGTLLKASEYSGSDGVPLISVGEVGAGSFRVTKHTPLVPAMVLRRLPQYVLRRGDIVFGRKGAVERSALVTDSEDGWFLGSDGISLRPQDAYYPPFLACQFQRYEVQAWLLKNATGTTMPSLNQAILGRVQIPCAPLPEQRAIAGALSDVDALLDGLTRLIAKKRDLKQGAMHQLLTGQTRLPGFHMQWERSTIGREFEVALGKMLDSETNTGTPKPYIGNKSVQWGRIEIEELQFVRLTPSDIQRYRLAKNDLLVCEGGEVGRAAIWESPIEECYYQKALHRLRPRRGMSPHFMLAMLKMLAERGALDNYVMQTSIAHLPKEKFIGVPIPAPAVSEQNAIAAVLSDMDAELSALEARLAKTRLLKQAMMQELLTGRTRLV
jgi:type I restriction enzyme, S subunit